MFFSSPSTALTIYYCYQHLFHSTLLDIQNQAEELPNPNGTQGPGFSSCREYAAEVFALN
jgi:hypothetical protein